MFWLFYTTHASSESANEMAQQLLEKRLIACVNIMPIQSAYWWQGSITTDNEWVAIMKTAQHLADQLEAEIIRLHPYEIPCIVRWQVQANIAYQTWIEDNVRK